MNSCIIFVAAVCDSICFVSAVTIPVNAITCDSNLAIIVSLCESLLLDWDEDDDEDGAEERARRERDRDRDRLTRSGGGGA